MQRPWEESGHQRPEEASGGLREGTSALGLGHWRLEAGLMAGGAAKQESGRFRHWLL